MVPDASRPIDLVTSTIAARLTSRRRRSTGWIKAFDRSGGEFGGPLKRSIWPILFAAALLWPAAMPLAGDHAKPKPRHVRKDPPHVTELLGRPGNKVEIVTFDGGRWAPIKIVRGNGGGGKPDRVETVTFANPAIGSVQIIRGASALPMPGPGDPARGTDGNVETVTFSDPHDHAVTVIRGLAFRGPDIGLFGPASRADLDRIAFAVDGIESNHGSDPRMWRPEIEAPQGPMQVSLAAVTDLGGGDRFDLMQNRRLGRAYLALMFRRYGNWPDAVAAYNWGPGNLDWWIASGRAPEKLPLSVERYRNRVFYEVGYMAAAPASRK